MANSEVKGLEVVQRNLLSIAARVVQEFFPDALANAAAIVSSEVSSRATGELKSGLVVQTEVKPLTGRSVIGYQQTPSEQTGQALDQVAAEVEFGHAMVTHKGNKIGHVPAYPFLRPATDAAASHAIEVFADTLSEEFK